MSSFPSAKLGGVSDSQDLQRYFSPIHWRPLQNHGHLVDSSPRLLEHFLETTLLADRRTEGVEGKGHLSNFPKKKETNGEKMHLFLLQDSQMSVPLWEVYNRHWWPIGGGFKFLSIFSFSSLIWGRCIPNLTSIFFKWGVQPPTSDVI